MAEEGFKPIDHKSLNARQFGAMRRNVENTYTASSGAEKASGHDWYPKAHDEAKSVGGGDTRRGAGVIAALSPQTHWDLNKTQAHEIVHLKSSDVDALHKGDRSVLAGKALNRQPSDRVLAAVRIHTGEDDPAKSLGIKTGNFFHNIHDPSDNSHVTIDVHAHDIAVGQKLQHKVNRGLSAPGRYNTFASVYHQASDRLGVRPNEVQATTWEHWRTANTANTRGRHGSL